MNSINEIFSNKQAEYQLVPQLNHILTQLFSSDVKLYKSEYRTESRSPLSRYFQLMQIIYDFKLGPSSYQLLLHMHRNEKYIIPSLYRSVLLTLSLYGKNIDLVKKTMDLGKQYGYTLNRYDYEDLMKVYIKGNQIDLAIQSFEEMKKSNISPTTWSYNILLNGLKCVGDWEHSLYYFHEMQERGLLPDSVTCNTLIRTFGISKKTSLIPEFISQMKDSGISIDINTYSSLTWVYANEKNIKQCEYYYEEMKSKQLLPSLNIINNMIKAYALNGKTSKCTNLMNEIHKYGLEENVCFLGCSSIALDYNLFQLYLMLSLSQQPRQVL